MHENTPFIVTGAVYSGDPEEGMKVIQPLRDIGTPLADISGPLPFVGCPERPSTSSSRAERCAATGSPRSSTELTDPILDIIVDKARSRPHDRVFVVTFFMGGAINHVAVEDTPYSERSANWMVSIDGNWDRRRRRRQGHLLGARRVEPGARARDGSQYLNFTGVEDEAVTVGVESAFDKANLQRLGEIKTSYDPDNLFRLNNNIPPAS